MCFEAEASLSTTYPDSAEARRWRTIRFTGSAAGLTLICSLALLIRLVFSVGLGFADDLTYASIAKHILHSGHPNPISVFDARLFFVYAQSFFACLFGLNEHSLILFPLLCSLAEIVLIYKLGELLFHQKAGLIAAGMLACYPLNIIYSTRIMPDIPLAFFLGLSIYFFMRGHRAEKNEYFICAGICLGLAWLIKAVAAVQLVPLAGFCAGWSIMKKRVNRGHALFFASFFLVLLLEGCYYLPISGDFLTRFDIISQTYTKTAYQGDRLIDIITYYPALVFLRHHSHFTYLFGLFFYAAGAAAICKIGLCFRYGHHITSFFSRDAFAGFRNKKAAAVTVLLSWCIFWIVYLQVGSMSITEYRIIEKHERFLSIITIPLFLLLSSWLSRYKTSVQRYAKSVMLVMLIFSSFYFTAISWKFHSSEIHQIRTIKEHLDDRSFLRAYADAGTIYKLEFLYGFKRNEDLHELNHLDSVDAIPDSSHVIIYGRFFRDVKQPIKKQLGNVGQLWKNGWTLDKIAHGYTIKNFNQTDPLIFHIPINK